MATSLLLNLSASFVHSKRLLVITPEFIEFKNVNFSKFEIADLRYGIEPIYGFRVRIGRMYCIDVRNLAGKVLKIRFTSFYGIKKKKSGDVYSSILNALFENFIKDISGSYVNDFIRHNEISLLGVYVMKEGIKLHEKSPLIPWTEVGVRSYWSYCSIITKSNPAEYKTFTYITDWNAIVLYSVVKYILKAKDLLPAE